MAMRSTMAVTCVLLGVLGTGCAKVGDVLGTTFGESSGTPPPNAVLAPVDAPPAGTKWIVRATSYNENTARAESRTITWTSMGEGTHGGRSVFRLSDGSTIHVHDRATGSWLAVLDRESREMIVYQPHDGTFSSPLWVGKQWVARYGRHDRLEGRSLDNLVVVWKVAAYEDVQVPAGKFKAFRVEAWPDDRDQVRKRTYWYAPDVKLVVKEVTEGFGEPYAIGVGRDRIRSTTELVEYVAVERPAPGATARPQQKPETPAERASRLADVLGRDRDVARRSAAAEALAEVDPSLASVAVAALAKAAGGDTEPAVRLIASRGLARWMPRTPEAAPALVEAAKRSREAVAVLVEAALNPEGRLAAIELIAKVGPPARDALGVLRETLQADRNGAARAAAASAIGRIGPTAAEVLPLVRALRDASPDVQRAAALSLKDRSAEVLRLLTPDLQDSTPEIRRGAAEALGSLAAVAPIEALPLLRGALEDRDAGVRATGARVLGRAGAPALPALREALRHDDAAVRVAAAEALASLPAGRAENASALTPLLDDPDETVRVTAVRALTALGADARSAAPALKRVAERDSSAEVRFLAARALDSLGAR